MLSKFTFFLHSKDQFFLLMNCKICPLKCLYVVAFLLKPFTVYFCYMYIALEI